MRSEARGGAERTLVVGSGALARKIVEEMKARPALRAALLGVVAEGAGGGSPRALAETLGGIIDRIQPDRIVVALGDRRGCLPVRQLLEARAQGILVEDGVEVYERLTGKLALEEIAPTSLAFSHGFRMSRRHEALARAFGLVVATLGLLVLAPVLGVIALLIKLDSRGPVFFLQERAGLHGRSFNLIKFRTMRPRDGRTSEWERDNCHRITRVGARLRRCRLDELPQLVNVLRGDMNLVGPRPHPVTNLGLFILTLRNMNELTGDAMPYYALRCAVRPGITGWAQVRYGYANGLEEEVEKIRYDLYYLKHMSPWLDLRILLETFTFLLFKRGSAAVRAGNAEVRHERAEGRLSAA